MGEPRRPEVRRVSKPMPEPAYPTYVVKQSEYDTEPVQVVTVNKPNSPVDQSEELLKKILAVLTPVVSPPAKAPELSPMDKLVQLLLLETAKSNPVPLAPAEPPGLETLLRTYLAEQQSPRQELRFRPVRRNWSDVRCFSCGKTGHSVFPIYITGLEGREDIDWLLDDIAKDGYGPPAGGKRRLIRREGFASRISKDARPHDPGGGGGTTGFPDPRNVMKMDIMKSPRDIVENRNVKPMQVSSQVAKKASSDGTTTKQGRAAHRQSTRTTVNKLHTDFADIPKPTLSQRPAVSAEEAGPSVL